VAIWPNCFGGLTLDRTTGALQLPYFTSTAAQPDHGRGTIRVNRGFSIRSLQQRPAIEDALGIYANFFEALMDLIKIVSIGHSSIITMKIKR
jgi:hypothetical protein